MISCLLPVLLSFLLFVFPNNTVFGASQEIPSAIQSVLPDSMKGRVLLGDCVIPNQYEKTYLDLNSPFLCFKGRTGAEGIFGIAHREHHRVLYFGEAYAGLHFGKYFSLHIKPIYRRVLAPKAYTIERKDWYNDYFIAQIGNPASSKWRLAFGKMRLPFGFDFNPLMEYYKTLEDRTFWSSPSNGFKVTYDDLRSLQVELGGGLSNNSLSTTEKNHSSDVFKNDDAISLRVSTDFPALEGSKLQGSIYTERNGTRRYGLGFLNINRKKDISAFEWVRHFPVTQDERLDFTQLLRLTFQSHPINNGRWLFNYDDERYRYRLGTLGYDYLTSQWLYLRFTVSYLKSEINANDSYWFGATGFHAQI